MRKTDETEINLMLITEVPNTGTPGPNSPSGPDSGSGMADTLLVGGNFNCVLEEKFLMPRWQPSYSTLPPIFGRHLWPMPLSGLTLAWARVPWCLGNNLTRVWEGD